MQHLAGDEGLSKADLIGDDGAARVADQAKRAGDAVLLSPAGTSFDAYPRFEARGEAFAAAVAALADFEEVSP